MPEPRSNLDGHLIANFDASNLVDITARVSMDIITNELTWLKTDPPTGWGSTEVTVIEPDFDLHDIMTIDQGLIRIRIGHGYMRADNMRFTHTFSRQFVQVFDPETCSYYPEEVDPTLTVRGDRQVCYEEHITCEFFDAILNAQIMSQSVPTTRTPGQTASVAITVKNTGNVTWTASHPLRSTPEWASWPTPYLPVRRQVHGAPTWPAWSLTGGFAQRIETAYLAEAV